MKTFLLPAIAVFGLSACLETTAADSAGPRGEMPTAANGRALFVENCAVCHGESGKGDGPMARAMTTAPRDLTLIQVRNGDVFPRAKVLSTIDGYAKSDLDGPGMPEFGDLLRGEEVPYDTGDGILTPTPRRLVAIVEYIATIQQSR